MLRSTLGALSRLSPAARVVTVRKVGDQGRGSDDPDAPVELSNPFEQERTKCILCRLNITPDFKNPRLLSQFQSRFTGKIYGRHITGLCKKRQEQVEEAVIQSQNAGLMAYYLKDLKFVDDPKLFDPERPLRPHPY